jgi:hypothetical protein
LFPGIPSFPPDSGIHLKKTRKKAGRQRSENGGRRKTGSRVGRAITALSGEGRLFRTDKVTENSHVIEKWSL